MRELAEKKQGTSFVNEDKQEQERVEEEGHILREDGEDKEETGGVEGLEATETTGEGAEDFSESEELLSQLEETRLALSKAEERYIRLRADFENYRRRSREQLSQASQAGAEELFLRLLPILDNLERSIKSDGEPEKWREGVEMVTRQFLQVLAEEGVTPIKAIGEIFDPQKHEAVAREVSTKPENQILEELQKGYTFGEKTLRPSLVKVAVKEGDSC